MTSVVLTYTGSPGKKLSAQARLRRSVPGAVLTPKTSTLVEAQLDEEQLAALEQNPEWAVSQPSFAEIRKPVFNLKNARAKLAK
ncbi:MULTISPECIES: hypothetical protein [unclassified Variovorax]|uniref:hypothetical protein n=1 Tax=unclassified Variovorax TaxID=663243 RepID=UPI000895AF8B|nr:MULTISPECIES: hypothetical protein [unclassified Variovorax]SDX30333.1 hypothetical protein SAMN05518669_104164 [Variovorax sp. YR634]SDZ22470.1 hypothetical protein SAMN05518854_104311 [Variovorax sp. YR266]SET53611.1 hypothetical protein SAMN05443580_104166 [Variovorax sp. OV084]SOD30984.1 hypothetical protein SAMN05518800_6608 [Variovorax sp. YR752]